MDCEAIAVLPYSEMVGNEWTFLFFMSWHFILRRHKRKTSYCELDGIFDLCIELGKGRSNQCTRCLIYEHDTFCSVGEMFDICSVIVTPFVSFGTLKVDVVTCISLALSSILEMHQYWCHAMSFTQCVLIVHTLQSCTRCNDALYIISPGMLRKPLETCGKHCTYPSAVSNTARSLIIFQS